jgi:hypothetical protein
VGAFIEAAAGHSLADEEGEGLIRAVWDETEGNPFFVAEVMRHLAESGGIEQRDGRWVTTVPVEQLGIPEGVRDVVGRRLSRLPEGVDRILGVAAVIGLEFEPAVVSMAGGFRDDDLISALEVAAAARLVSEVPGGVGYRFSHGLVRATLYDEMSGPRRMALHRRVAEAIEVTHGRQLDDYLPALAHHWARASAPTAGVDRAVEYATRAGDRALVQLAHDEAASYYAQALDLLGGAEPNAHDGRGQELLISLGEAQRRAGDPRHRETLLAAARLARERGDAGSLARAALANTRGLLMVNAAGVDRERVAMLSAALDAVDIADSPLRARLLASFALESMTQYEGIDTRLGLCDEALAMARRVGDRSTLAAVLMARYYAILCPATLDERVANIAELTELAEVSGDPLTRCRVAFLRNRCLLEIGDVAGADRAFELGESLAQELNQPTLLWMAGLQRTGFLARRGRLREAEQLIVRNRELGVASGQLDAEPYYAAQMAFVLREQGRLAELADTLEALCDRWPLPAMRALLAEAWCVAGRDADARGVFEQFSGQLGRQPLNFVWDFMMTSWASVAIHLAHDRDISDVYDAFCPFARNVVAATSVVCGAITHHLGVLAAALGHLDVAEEHLAAAAAMHDSMQLPAWRAHTAVERGSVLLRRNKPGDRDRAVNFLHGALAGAVEYGLGGDERRARELLAGAGR